MRGEIQGWVEDRWPTGEEIKENLSQIDKDKDKVVNFFFFFGCPWCSSLVSFFWSLFLFSLIFHYVQLDF